MVATRIYLALIGSLVIHGGGIYYLHQTKHNTWQLSSSKLSVGNTDNSLLENINLIVNASNKIKTPTKEISEPSPKPPKNIVDKAPKLNKANHDKLKKPLEPKLHKTEAVPQTKSNEGGVSRAEISTPPKLLNAPPPLVYPTTALDKNASGRVKVRGIIDHTGYVISVEIVNSSGIDELDVAAKAWFKQLKFSPAQNNGGAVSASVVQNVDFVLNDTVS